MFLGREKEQSRLNQLWERGRFEMIVMYGRRRVGKTTLINEFCKNKNAIFYAASEVSSQENLQAFSSVIGQNRGSTGASTYNSYMELLIALGSIAKQERIVVVIDEYPYLAKAEPGFSSLLQNFIDAAFKKTKMFLILCGSSMSFMENQVLGYESPLFGRRTAQFKLVPFTYYETAQWFPKLQPPDQAVIYGVTGGIPLYVEHMTGYSDIREAVLSEVFDDNAYLYEEPGNLLMQELREPQNYNMIIGAIADGCSRMNEIATKVSLESAVCTKYIKKLMELGILQKERPIGEGSSKKVIYRISDQMFRFWYRFVPGNRSAIVSGRIRSTYATAVEPYMSDYMGLTFEEMCKQYILYYDEAMPIDLGEIGQWWGTHKEGRRQVQIDIVVLSPDRKKAIFGECKYKNELLDVDVLEQLMYASEAYPERLSEKHYYLFSKSGFTSRMKERAAEEHIRLVSLYDMMPVIEA